MKLDNKAWGCHGCAVREVVEGILRLEKRLPDKLFFLAYKAAKSVIDISCDAVILGGLGLLTISIEYNQNGNTISRTKYPGIPVSISGK